ncbi:tRNA (adenosine(37)-N6)-threonylcarbamoyltransferase complex ATPase subunit type 1 TsaE [Colwellia sp. D2M02]|uniref:tRNA (Adenosine(37)-N6)-threonylcarbamoyltransferase complex ATPase subunit type 1 TsaE n=1 Tax=Colwellia asteriadis TaxID=517723 RepID=A0ABN1LCB5_9GAMM|nr:tRNA (adenosine(37)-N6)-threonylcarbamoyltransferase complex ATPase subunit type 1 TsaE [Colwellia sp. D2M02]MBU2895003.1 tRNA (adenosine(37)-N6)-threonylcarbamoyltransferase complex ATPase subunit type 1 TsaE [Colwellia sp. D2M02]
MKQIEYFLKDEQATLTVGAQLAQALQSFEHQQSLVVYLNGDLGAGKTTLTRGFVCGMGHNGNVKSPTYTIVEPYELAQWRVFHFDLYRLSDPEELEYMGIRDYFNDDCCCFIEWPEKGTGLLAKADLIINMAYQNEQRTINLQAETPRGEAILTVLNSEVASSLS